MADPDVAIPPSPAATTLGWRLVAQDAEKGWVRVAFDGGRGFANPGGFVQGGFLAAMLDDCMGPAAWIMSRGQAFTATIDMNVTFLGAVKPGPLFGEGQVVQMGKTIAFIEARLMDADGRVLVRATSSARLVPASRAVG